MTYKVIIFLLVTAISFAQKEPVEINKKDLIEIAKKEDKFTLVYTFSIACQPCITGLSNTLELTKKYNLNTYVLLVEKSESNRERIAVRYLRKQKTDIQIAKIKAEYGKRLHRRYENFLKDITPEHFENINDFSKYILLDNKGNVLMVTNYKDSEKYGWENAMPMLKEKIIPFLNKN